MSELTREYLDKKLDSQTTELKSYVDNKIDDVKNLVTEEVAELAGMVSRRFDEVEKKLDVRAEVDELKVKMS